MFVTFVDEVAGGGSFLGWAKRWSRPTRATQVPPGAVAGAARARQYSARFRGLQQTDHIRLIQPDSQSPLWSIQDGGAFWWRFDLRPDGLDPGQISQTVMKSAAFQLELEPSGAELRLRATVPGLPPLIAGGGAGGVTLRPGVWARVTWGYSKNLQKHFLDVRVWNITTGWYDAAIPESGCIYQPTTLNPNDPGDVWVGYDGAAASSRFKGRLDSVNLYNYNAVQAPGGCVVQP